MKTYIIALLILSNVTIQANDTPPNVLFIAIDDLRPDLNCYEETAAEQMGGPAHACRCKHLQWI